MGVPTATVIMATTGGMAAGVAMALDARAGEGVLPPEPEQLDMPDLLGLPLVTGESREGPGSAIRGRGRPRGARNRRTTEIADYLIGQYGHPLEMLVQVAMMPVERLAQLKGCNEVQALEQKRLAAAAALPYLAQRQPLAVDVTNHRSLSLTIIEGGDDGAGEDAEVVVVDIVDIQGVSDDRAG